MVYVGDGVADAMQCDADSLPYLLHRDKPQYGMGVEYLLVMTMMVIILCMYLSNSPGVL